MGRKRQLNVRIDSDLKDDFNKVCRESGTSTCSVVEGLLRAWLEGHKHAAAPNASKSYTINLKQERVVKRVRRRDVKFIPKANHYADGMWYYDDSHPDHLIVEQPESWGENKCADGFVWMPLKKQWVKPISEEPHASF